LSKGDNAHPETRAHSIEPAIDASEPFIHLIEGPLDVGHAGVKRMRVHGFSANRTYHAEPAGKQATFSPGVPHYHPSGALSVLSSFQRRTQSWLISNPQATRS
jgi:hypothetical protein